MTDTIEFGKRINHYPIFISFLISFLIGGLGAIINVKVAILSFLVVLFLLLCVYFPLNVPALFGHWQLENHGVSYYKMNSYWDKLKMIVLPDTVEFQFISYSQIKGFKIVEQNQTYSMRDLLTIKPAKQSVFPWLRKPFFLKLELNQSSVNLDLASDQRHDPNNTMFRLSNALNIINKKTETDF